MHEIIDVASVYRTLCRPACRGRRQDRVIRLLQPSQFHATAYQVPDASGARHVAMPPAFWRRSFSRARRGGRPYRAISRGRRQRDAARALEPCGGDRAAEGRRSISASTTIISCDADLDADRAPISMPVQAHDRRAICVGFYGSGAVGRTALRPPVSSGLDLAFRRAPAGRGRNRPSRQGAGLIVPEYLDWPSRSAG